MRGVHRLRTFAKRITNPEAWLRDREDAELERMMGFRGQYESHRAFQMNLLREQGVAPSSRVLEVGCGPLTLGAPLMAYLEPGRYCGIDIRPDVLDLAHRVIARQRLADRNARIIHSTSFGEAELADLEFDTIVSFSVLYHLQDQLVADLLKQVARRLAVQGQFIANINVEHPSGRWLEFPFNQRSIDFYAALATGAGLRTEVLGQGFDLGMARTDLASQNFYLRFSRDI